MANKTSKNPVPSGKRAPMPNRKESVRPGGQSKQSRVALILIAVCLVLAVIIIAVVVSRHNSVHPTSANGEVETNETENAVPEVDTSEIEGKDYYATIDVQDYGVITIHLDSSAAPQTVANFVNLAQSGFYDGLTFHRIMEGFMIQGGDPLGNGTGGSDQTIYGEFSQNGYENPLSHTRGAISMARSPYDLNSASSQFFIVHEDSTFLDGQYAAFGYVTEGMEVVDAIAENAHPTDSNGTIPAEQQPVINSITITETEPAQG